ncbi:MAG: TlpA family protein disulfide reductase [Bacteroidetes bacterium]|nr:TlpA family protein disulfide reductase [Bacteroidota bacterium]
MKRLLLLFFLASANLLFSQKLSVIKITDLEKRIGNASDTTYIVNFWATWCAPCVKELPDFDSISKVYGSEKVKVLLVSMDFKEDLDSKVIPFCKRKQLHSEVFVLDELNGNYFIPRVSDKWTGAIPATLILNNAKNYREFYEKKLNYLFLEGEIKKIKGS